VTYLSVGDLDGEPIDDGERGLLAVGVRREELGEQLIVLLAQVRVQRCRSLLRPAPTKNKPSIKTTLLLITKVLATAYTDR
jgi:hypothetical protein